MRDQLSFYGTVAVAGALTGLSSATFHFLLDRASEGRAALRTNLAHAPVPGWFLLMALGAAIVCFGRWLVRRFAPETSGSGVQEIEGILQGVRRMRWRRVLPVKFFGGLLSLGSGMVLGREGPTVHLGGALGGMMAERQQLNAYQLIAAGAGAGLAAAFNAPLAGIIFVTEEMREQFDYTFKSLQAVILASCVAVATSDWWLGQGPNMPVLDVQLAPLVELPLFLLLGVFVGAFGALFNKMLLGSVRLFSVRSKAYPNIVAMGVGAALGALVWTIPDATGGGEGLVEHLLAQRWSLGFLLLLLVVRTLTTMGSYGSGVPGGIFAPMLALGTIVGITFGQVSHLVIPSLVSTAGMFAVSAMGALFAATVGAPLTGVVLVMELTGAFSATMTIILTCLTAAVTAQSLGTRPIYHQLLERTLSLNTRR